MITWLFQHCRHVYRFVTNNDSPKQMAVAVAFGVLLGLVPKGNLLAVGISGCFLAVQANLATGMLVALAFSFVAYSIDGVFDNVGHYVLTAPVMQDSLVTIYQLPFAPWTAFNNTVVCGSLLIGLIAFYPTYRLTLPVFTRWRRGRTTPETTPETAGSRSDKTRKSAEETKSKTTPQPTQTAGETPSEIITKPALSTTPELTPETNSKNASESDPKATSKAPRKTTSKATPETSSKVIAKAPPQVISKAASKAIAKATSEVTPLQATPSASPETPPREPKLQSPPQSSTKLNLLDGPAGSTDEVAAPPPAKLSTTKQSEPPGLSIQLPAEGGTVESAPENAKVRESLRRRRFLQFVADVESLSRRRVA
ncbi:MAG: TIGR03546 family protein [Pirellulaceae bacterium]